MIDTKKAKTRLLSLAFQGVLVDYPSKDSVNEALDVIHQAQKNYSPITAEERLIDVPFYWNWSRLDYLTNNHGQMVPDKDFCYIDVGTLDNVHQKLAAKENLVSAKDAPSRARKVVELGDVLYSTVRPYLHNICIIDRIFSRMPIASTAFCVMQVNKSVLLNKFLFYWLLTAEFDKYSNGDPSKGALYPAIGEKDLLHGVIPIPPIDEQAMIVEKIEQAFSILDTIDTLQAQYADNLTVLKSKLIDVAIQGKLTEQLQEDGMAEELYQQIQAEKQALIKAGKVKTEKPLPEITTEEIPFEIPTNWKWIRFRDLGVFSGGKTPSMAKKEYWSNGVVPWVTSKDMKQKYIASSEMLISELAAKEMAIHPEKTVLFVVRSGILRRMFPVAILTEKGTVNQDLKALELYVPDMCEYVYYVLKGLEPTILFKYTKDGTTVNNIVFDALLSMPIPLPPLAEQKRIVTHLNELFCALDA